MCTMGFVVSLGVGCGLDVGVAHVFSSVYEAVMKVLVRESKS